MLSLLAKLRQWEELTSQSVLNNVDSDKILIMNGISWDVYETLLKTCHNNSHYRFKYLQGTLEIMSPSRRHEVHKKIIALLLETYFLELAIDFYPLGSTTFRSQAAARGIEPDECYCFHSEKPVPDLAIEIIVTSAVISDLLIYQSLGVPEVWFWQHDQFSLYSLSGNKYEQINKSVVLPDLDLNLLVGLVISGEKPKDLIVNFRQSSAK